MCSSFFSDLCQYVFCSVSTSIPTGIPYKRNGVRRATMNLVPFQLLGWHAVGRIYALSSFLIGNSLGKTLRTLN